MNCSTSREYLALWVEGDLPGTQVQVMEEHLASCPACRTFRTELADSQARFRTLIDEPVNVEALDKIREAVLVRTRRGSKTAGGKRPLMPAWAYTAAAVLLIALIGWTALRPSPEAEPVRTAQVEAVPEEPEVLPAPEVAPPEPVTQPEPVAVAAITEAPAPPAPAIVETETVVADATLNRTQSLTVKLLTDDPNVVIYWVVDQVGGME